ncbi:MAG: STAS domain-containing protein [Candidatus Eremiobacteraeota bacterium]|nr:STAS domain-containing protein [Candidatus Eremiobacteraeota bacterium]MBV9409146.1 STAS domain-containing protein [Candidatus Eremiobacteraeota bacterium]
MRPMNDIQLHDALRLHADDQDARSKVAAAVDSLLAKKKGTPRLTVVLDGERLPAETVAALVTGLRRVRERGGAIAVAPATPEVRDALAVTGLDRVFAFPLVPDERPGSGNNLLRRMMAASFAVALAFVGLTVYAQADPAPVPSATVAAAMPATTFDHPVEPSAILGRIQERNPNLSSYQGRLHVDLRLTSFPFIRQHLDGTTYYKRPSNYEVVFDRVPALAKGFDKMFTDVGDPSSWDKRFVMTYEGERDYQGRKDLELRLVQRVRGMIDHETVLVDPNNWVIDSIRYDYYNGGHITMTQTFRNVGGYFMLAEQQAEIAIPYARAVAHGSYTDYKTNVAIDDAVFTKKNK